MPLRNKLALMAVLLSAAASAQNGLFTSEDVHEKRAVLQGHAGAVTAVAFSPDGESLLTASADAAARLWDVRIMDLPILKYKLSGHEDGIYAAAYSPDGRRVATASFDKTLRVWRAKDGRLERSIDSRDALPFCVAFATDSRVLAAGGDDAAVRLWDADTGRLLHVLKGHKASVYAVAWSKKGILASAGDDRRVLIWNVDRSTLQPAVSIDAHDGLVSALAFSPDGKRLASGSWDRRIKVWDAESGKLLGLMRGHADAVTSLAFLSDGTLISGGRDKARFWDPETGLEKELLNAPDDAVLSVAASPGAPIMASGNVDGTARLYLLRGTADLRAARPPPRKEPFSPW